MGESRGSEPSPGSWRLLNRVNHEYLASLTSLLLQTLHWGDKIGLAFRGSVYCECVYIYIYIYIYVYVYIYIYICVYIYIYIYAYIYIYRLITGLFLEPCSVLKDSTRKELGSTTASKRLQVVTTRRRRTKT